MKPFCLLFNLLLSCVRAYVHECLCVYNNYILTLICHVFNAFVLEWESNLELTYEL